MHLSYCTATCTAAEAISELYRNLIVSQVVEVVRFRGRKEREVVAAVRVERHRDDDGVPSPHRHQVGPAKDRAETRGQQVRNEVL